MNPDLKGTASCYMVKAGHGNCYEELRAVSQGRVSEEIAGDPAGWVFRSEWLGALFKAQL